MDERTIVTKKDVRTRMLQERSRLARDPDLQAAFRAALDGCSARLPYGVCVGGYVPFRGEPDISESLCARDHSVILALPYALADGRMVYLRRGKGKLEKDALGIPAPMFEGGTEVVPDVLFVPCVAYSTLGHRLGYGKGCFDRYLAACDPRPVAIGVAYSALVAEASLFEAHDERLDALLTEKGLLDVSGRFAKLCTPKGEKKPRRGRPGSERRRERFF